MHLIKVLNFPEPVFFSQKCVKKYTKINSTLSDFSRVMEAQPGAQPDPSGAHAAKRALRG